MKVFAPILALIFSFRAAALTSLEDNEPSRFVTPIAELEVIADFGNSNATVRLLSPIISSEVSRLLKAK